MKSSASNYSSRALLNYVKKISDRCLEIDSPEQSAYKLLSLLFAYKRSQYKLNLRWNREESNQLALITLQDLSSKKKTDPVLNGIYSAILILTNDNEEAAKKLLETAEARIDEISVSQRAKAKTLRELNPVLERVTYHYKKNPTLSPGEIIDRLKVDVGSNNITDFDEELGRFFYNEKGKKNPMEKHISLDSVRNFISKLRKK